MPRVSNSNETEHSGRIHKRGTKLGRTALVQSALIAANYSPYLKRFYEQVKARRGAGKAIIALARKFLGVIYRTLKNKWVFEDFPNFVLAEAVMKNSSGTHHRESQHLVPAAPSVVGFAVAERCSAARVRCAAAHTAAPLPPPRRSA